MSLLHTGAAVTEGWPTSPKSDMPRSAYAKFIIAAQNRKDIDLGSAYRSVRIKR